MKPVITSTVGGNYSNNQMRCTRPLTSCTFCRRVQLSGFPVKESHFEFEHVYQDQPTSQMYEELLRSVPNAFMNERQNSLIYLYGEKATPRRQCLFGTSHEMSEAITSTSGWAQVLLKHIFESDLGNCIIQLQACTLGTRYRTACVSQGLVIVHKPGFTPFAAKE